MVLLMVVIAMVVAAGTAVLARRWITTPLTQISEAVARVTAGDLHHRIPAAGPPDLAEHAVNVEGMRARTVALLQDAITAREALEQQGQTVVTLRSQLDACDDDLLDAVTVAATLQPAEGLLAGDWYDCLDLGQGRVALVVADVSGHGPAAGVFALRVKELLTAALGETSHPGEALGWVARHLKETDEEFVTCLLVCLDTTSGHLAWANAGHPDGLVLTEDPTQRLSPTGPLLGPLPGRWSTAYTTLPSGGTVLAFTDGIIEARTDTEQFGEERILQIASAATSPEQSSTTSQARFEPTPVTPLPTTSPSSRCTTSPRPAAPPPHISTPLLPVERAVDHLLLPAPPPQHRRTHTPPPGEQPDGGVLTVVAMGGW